MWLKCNHCRRSSIAKRWIETIRSARSATIISPISVIERINLLVDLGTFKEWDPELEPQDPLQFQDTRTYKDRIKAQREKTGRKDAMVISQGAVNGRKGRAVCVRFGFMGGSIGSVVGERFVARSIVHLEGHAVDSCDGVRRRTHAGGNSLARANGKTSAAVAKLGEAKLLFIRFWPIRPSAASPRVLPMLGMSSLPSRKR